MRLIVLPANPGHGNGNEIAVASDLARFGSLSQDLVLCYSNQSPVDLVFTHLPRMKCGSLRHLVNLLRRRPAPEVWAIEIRRAIVGRESQFDEIFCGDAIFYQALRHLFPSAHLKVRFQNFFSFAKYRQSLRRYPISFRMAYHLQSISRLEADVLSDKNVTPIFITEDEFAYARLAFPNLRGECWPIISQTVSSTLSIKPPTHLRLVYFGSASAAHTAVGIRMLCRTVFPKIAATVEGVELHLFGGGTESFDNVSKRIYGHGHYEGSGLPFDGDGLFVVPDLHGCGVKLKVADLLRAKAPFISTNFGVSGYSIPQNPHILTGDIEEWPKMVLCYFSVFTSRL